MEAWRNGVAPACCGRFAAFWSKHSRCAATGRLGRRGASRRRLARDEGAERVPSFAPFGFALPKFRFEVSEVIRVALHLVQRL